MVATQVDAAVVVLDAALAMAPGVAPGSVAPGSAAAVVAAGSVAVVPRAAAAPSIADPGTSVAEGAETEGLRRISTTPAATKHAVNAPATTRDAFSGPAERSRVT